MNKLHLRNPSSNSKGISLIEILLGLAVLVILLSFAIPSASGAAIKAEMSAAMENVEYSIRIARQTARINEIPVSLNFSGSGEEGTVQTISFSTPQKKHSGSVQIQEFSVPSELMLVSDQESFVFDERGLVRESGKILLVSVVDESISSTITIN
jgi:Tfp pilus assembly protein FimT